MDELSYLAPQTLDETTTALADHGGSAAILAGGQSLLPMLRHRLADYDTVIDINGLGDLAYVEVDDDAVRVGGLARHHDVATDPGVRNHCRILHEAARGIGDEQVRNRGTICGSVAHADPAGDPPVVAAALGATITARDADGGRSLDATSFYGGFYETELTDREIVTEVAFPTVSPPTGAAYEKYEPSHGAYPVATVAGVVTLDGDVVADATVVTGAVEEGPTFVPEAAAELEGGTPTDDRVEAAGVAVGEAADPIEDADGSPEFKREVLKALATRALRSAVDRARGDVR